MVDRADSSIVAASANIGEGARIGRFCVIEDDVTIGPDAVVEDFTLVEAGATIGRGTHVGTHCKVGAGAVIGEDCRFTAYCEIRSECEVGDRVSMGSRCTLSAGTIVGDDVIIKYGFVATDTPVLGAGEKQTCVLKSRSKYGANVTIMPAVTIGEDSEIGACSQVRHDVPDGEVWYGSPAKFYRGA